MIDLDLNGMTDIKGGRRVVGRLCEQVIVDRHKLNLNEKFNTYEISHFNIRAAFAICKYDELIS